jgi:hypothetical protein
MSKNAALPEWRLEINGEWFGGELSNDSRNRGPQIANRPGSITRSYFGDDPSMARLFAQFEVIGSRSDPHWTDFDGIRVLV